METRATSVLFFVFFCAVSGVQGLGCPIGWQVHNESCYAFVKEHYSWFDAKTACNVLGARLAEIRTVEENTYLAQLLTSYKAQAWIGLEDVLEEGSFVWVSSRQRPEETHWASGEPDDRNGREDCAAMQPSGEWFDAECEAGQRPFICEMEAMEDGIIG